MAHEIAALEGKLLMIADRDALQMRVVLEAIRDLAAGQKQFQDLTLSTSALDLAMPE